MIVTHIISFILFPLLSLWGIKIEDRKDILNKQDTNAIKGIAAMCIVFAHFYDASSSVGIGIGKLWLNILARQSRQSGVARATFLD